MFRVIIYTAVGFVAGYLVNRYAIRREPPVTPTSPRRIEISPTPPAAEPAAAPQPETPAGPDDLTQVKGIGPTFAKRLNEAGIHTFHQLAEAAPEQLREITRIRDWQRPGPEEWLVAVQEIIDA